MTLKRFDSDIMSINYQDIIFCNLWPIWTNVEAVFWTNGPRYFINVDLSRNSRKRTKKSLTHLFN